METLYLQYYTTFTALAVAVVAVSGYANQLFKATGWKARVVSWVVAALAVLAGYFFDLGFLQDFSLIEALATALGAGLVANGVFSIDEVKQILSIIRARQPSVVAYTESQ